MKFKHIGKMLILVILMGTGVTYAAGTAYVSLVNSTGSNFYLNKIGNGGTPAYCSQCNSTTGVSCTSTLTNSSAQCLALKTSGWIWLNYKYYLDGREIWPTFNVNTTGNGAKCSIEDHETKKYFNISGPDSKGKCTITRK